MSIFRYCGVSALYLYLISFNPSTNAVLKINQGLARLRCFPPRSVAIMWLRWDKQVGQIQLHFCLIPELPNVISVYSCPYV